MISRRGALLGLFAAPAILKVESLMKLSRPLILPSADLVADFSTDKLIVKTTERYERGYMDYRLFRQIIEPALREHFDNVYRDQQNGDIFRVVTT